MKCMVIDGNSIINRAYYGIRPLTNREGLYTHAVFGFLTTLLRLKEEERPDALCVTFDLHAPTFRHKADEAYKATRKPMPEELRPQMAMLREVLGEMMSADMVQAVYETLHDRPDELFAFAHKQSEGQMDCKTLLKTLRRLRTPEKAYLDAMALLGAAAQNKAEWDEKALLRLERILKMDDCRAAAELSACANRAKTRLKKSAALLAMR